MRHISAHSQTVQTVSTDARNACRRIQNRSLMEETLQTGDADLISLSRPLVREPNLPMLMKEGKEKADCISCNAACAFFRIPYTHCVVLEKNGRKNSSNKILIDHNNISASIQYQDKSC